MNIFQTDYCLYCLDEIKPMITWESLFLGQKECYLCKECIEKLEMIGEETCVICGRTYGKIEEQYKRDGICYDCWRWEHNEEWRGVLKKNTSIYEYNDFIKEMFNKFKFRGDYQLVKAFIPEFKRRLENIDFDLLVPVPLSNERLYERGFNQAEAIIIEAGYKPTLVLKRIHSEKQSKKSREERIHVKQVFSLNESEMNIVKNKKVLLVDDIYTTGSTLRHAASILKQAGAKQICSITIARG